ncbi:hypothetical protein LRN42_000082 [Shigella sonnei]|nr:hypothetical protein [Shigella sonnei]
MEDRFMLIVTTKQEVSDWLNTHLNANASPGGVVINPVYDGLTFEARYERGKLTATKVNDTALTPEHAFRVFRIPLTINYRGLAKVMVVSGTVCKYAETSVDAFHDGVRHFGAIAVGYPEADRVKVIEEGANAVPTDVFKLRCLFETWRLASFKQSRVVPHRTVSEALRQYDVIAATLNRTKGISALLFSLNSHDDRSKTQNPDCLLLTPEGIIHGLSQKSLEYKMATS